VATILAFMIHQLAAGIVTLYTPTERHRWVIILSACIASFLRS